MCQLSLLPDKPGSTKYTPKHKLLPLRERPVERVSTRAETCTIAELLAALLGGPQPIETADALLAHFQRSSSTSVRSRPRPRAGIARTTSCASRPSSSSS